ncbi:hypothetical protein BDV11DRAFT_193452 [Aspergillus similis]
MDKTTDINVDDRLDCFVNQGNERDGDLKKNISNNPEGKDENGCEAVNAEPNLSSKGTEVAVFAQEIEPGHLSAETSKINTTNRQEHITFLDPAGTRWNFPYAESKTWNGVKELIKLVYVDCFLPSRYGDLLDQGKEGRGQSFSIIKVSPEQSYVLSKHWESLVSPGWEFKIEFYGGLDVLEEIRRTKAEEHNSEEDSSKEDKSEKDNSEDVLENVEETKISKIVYVAKYLVPDRDGDMRYESEQQFKDKLPVAVNEGRNHKSVLEEHREVCCNNNDLSLPLENRVDLVGIPVLHIHSPILLNALKAVISFQSTPDIFEPKQWRLRSLTSNLGEGLFIYPFTDLYHYRQRLLEYREEVKESHDADYSRICREHIDILIEYLDDQPAIALKDVERMLGQATPTITFSTLWFLLKPGSDVYVVEDGQLNAYVIESSIGGLRWNSPESWATPYCVRVWNLNFDGQHLTRSVKEVIIPVFDGERDVKSLPVFPTEFHTDEDPQNPLRQQLIDRGKKFVNMMKSPAFREYSGPSRLQGIREFNRARVVIDHTAQPWKLDQVTNHNSKVYVPVTSVYDVDLGERTRMPKCPCKACDENEAHRQHGVQRRIFDNYDNIDVNMRDNLTEHQYMLCASHVYGFVLKDRVWDVLDVSRLEEPRIQKNIIDMLVMKPEGNKQMIKAICDIYGKSYTQTFSSDFIQGKGEGQILLLHGPPGTGKTLTAESVAEYTARPLLSITAADLGHEPETLERNLLRFFRDAKKWNAIVLLDEADIYLETRSAQDLQRNSIVSIFLRALDYFQGILFLTTNRVGSFDEAFMSRIHVQIGYDRLDEDSRQRIWDNHFKKLSRNHENHGHEIRCSYDAKEFVRKSKDLRALEWNGREIRNAFQTAVALACFQAKQEDGRIPELTDEHLRQVVNMSQNFKNYLQAVRGLDEDLAFAQRVRNDASRASGNPN